MTLPIPCPSIDWGSAAQWFAALATFSAVLVALFKDEFLRFRRRPKLEPSIKLASPDCHKTHLNYQLIPTSIFGRTECYYLRLWIENRGKTRAEKVQVFAAKLSRKNADGSFAIVEDFLPMNLRWAHAETAPNGVEIFADGISPQMGKHCDLGHIVNPAARVIVGEDLPTVPTGKTLLALDLEVRPNTMSHLIPPGTYQLELRVAGANCSPVKRIIEITLTGEWFDDQNRMFSEGLGIRTL
jgi:hypothetical protein